jgi:hypothetical protein
MERGELPAVTGGHMWAGEDGWLRQSTPAVGRPGLCMHPHARRWKEGAHADACMHESQVGYSSQHQRWVGQDLACTPTHADGKRGPKAFAGRCVQARESTGLQQSTPAVGRPQVRRTPTHADGKRGPKAFAGRYVQASIVDSYGSQHRRWVGRQLVSTPTHAHGKRGAASSYRRAYASRRNG